MLVGVEYDHNKKSIISSFYNESGNLSFMSKPISEIDLFKWKYSSLETPYKAWDGNYVKKEKATFINRHRLEEIFIEKYKEKEKEVLYSSNKPKVAFLDIETEVNKQNDFPEPEEANFPVNLISIVLENKVFVLSTLDDFKEDEQKGLMDEVNEYFKDKGRDEQYNLVYRYYTNEYDLLKAFFHVILPKLGFITGWNVIGFDWQTLVNRADKLGLNIVENLNSKKVIGRNKIPVHLGMIDYDEVCRKFKPVKMADNYTLDYMSYRILGIRKLNHPYPSFYDFQQDHYMFTKYNIIDSVLVQMIDHEKKLLNIVYEMSNIAQTEVNKVFSPVFNTEIFMCRELLKSNLHMPEVKKENTKKGKYIGAYVMEPEPGHYKYISCFDFESEYPNIQMQWNIDPLVYVGKKGEVDLSKYNTKDLIITKNNTIFFGHVDSPSRIIQSRLFGKRKKIKGEGGDMQLVTKKIDELKREKQKLLQ